MHPSCPLCRQQLREPANDLPGEHGIVVSFSCATCGAFRVALPVLEELKQGKWAPYLHLVSATTKQANETIELGEDLFSRLKRGGLRERTVPEKIELMMRWYASKSTEAGQRVPYTPEADYPAAWCRSSAEWNALFRELKEMGYLRAVDAGAAVTVAGWKWLGELPRSTGAVAFIAMSFSDEMRAVSVAIHAGIEAAGYDPVRVDGDHYTGGVMDRILARIRESRFVVAEFGGNRGGVYYEAGFPLGLGIPTICLCSQAQLDTQDHAQRLHFDVHHLNFLPWEGSDLAGLTTKLRDRILALFGKGPLSQ